MCPNDFKEWLRLNSETKNTIRDYTSYVGNFFTKHNEFNQETVNAYLTAKLDQGVKKSTFNKIVFVLKKYDSFLKSGLVFPKAKKTDLKIKDYISLEDFEANVLSMVDLIFSDAYTYDMLFRFMFFTGLRAEEIIQLDKAQIDVQKEIIKVINTKGKVDREVFSIDEKFFKDFKDYLSKRSENKVFDLTYNQIVYSMKKLEEGTQINKHFHPHFFRISFAKHCVRLGINDSIIQKLLGHADINTTLLYCEPDRDMIQEACNRLKRKEK